jgi:twitching motility protein PilT
MILRDAEAIVLETGKVPTLRRRGQMEAMALPPLDGELLADFLRTLTSGRGISDGTATLPFTDSSGAIYAVGIERSAAGMRVVIRYTKSGLATAHGVGAQAEPAPTNDRAPIAATRIHLQDATTTAPLPESQASGRDGQAQLVALLAPVVAIARERGASDVLASSGQPVRARVAGELEALEASLDDAALASCVRTLGTNTDHSVELAGTRVRVNLFDHLAGFGLAARLIRDRVPQLSELALPAELAHATELRDGLVLVCGPTGSGKSTTLAALIEVLDRRRAAHVITLEDPIEYRFTGRRCVVHQRELGTHVPTFAEGLRAALREAPDVILLGELRDRETIGAALTAADTGHLVLATLHAPGAAGAVDRVIDAFPDSAQRQVRWQLAASLRMVITQYLLPRKGGGRVPAVEVVPVTAAVANIIRKGDLHTLPTAIHTGRDAGMVPLERSLARLVENGTVSSEVARRIAGDHDLLHVLTQNR